MFNADRTLSRKEFLDGLDPDLPVLIAGPTASGKSGLALEVAERQGGTIVNADALQVFDNWRVLTARPSAADEARAPHHLYGHVPGDADYSVGHWLREIAPLLRSAERPIIVGGTGLYFTALTRGLADIPPTPAEIRAEATARAERDGIEALIADLDSQTRGRIDLCNPARVMRAWEVQRTTGRGLAAWQDATPPALLPPERCQPVLLWPERDWLAARIATRFEQMLAQGVLEEASTNLTCWDATAASAKAIGAQELIHHLQGKLSLEYATSSAIVATRQYAKRQRTWFRSKMADWPRIMLPYSLICP